MNTKTGTGRSRAFSIIVAFMVMLSVFTVVATDEVDAASVRPSKVKTIKVVSYDYNALKITWSKASNAKQYKVYRATSKNGKYKLVKTTKSRSFVNKKLATGKKYYYKVRAINGSKKGAFSPKKYAAPTLKKPTGAKAVSADSASLKLSWKKVNGAKGYRVYRATSKDGKYTKVKTTTALSFTDTKLTTGKTYYYKIRAYRKVESKTRYGAYSTVISSYPKPAKVTGVKAVSTDKGGLKITWSKAAGAKGYEVYRATSKDGKYTKVKTTTALSFTDMGLSSEKTYYYKIRAYAKLGNISRYGNFSAIASATTISADEAARIEFRKQWISKHITADMTESEKVEAIQRYVADTEYGSGLSLYKPDENGVYGGTCYTGANFMYALCEDLGIPCEMRFAGNDLEEYHINYGQVAGHYNCFVWLDGVQYLADCTPGSYIAMFKWTPERWELSYKIAKGEIPITDGPQDEEPTPVGGIAGDLEFVSGFNVGMAYTKKAFSIPNKCVEEETGEVLDSQTSLHFNAYPCEIVEASSSNENVIKFDSGSCERAETVAVGTAVITVRTNDEDNTTWTYTITVY